MRSELSIVKGKGPFFYHLRSGTSRTAVCGAAVAPERSRLEIAWGSPSPFGRLYCEHCAKAMLPPPAVGGERSGIGAA